MFEVEYYTTTGGEKPAKEFLVSLETKMRVKAFASIELLEELGSELREPHSAPMGDGLFELRIKFASDISRIFYFFYVNNKIILTNGFIKKTKKTPKRYLDLARKYKKDYERRSQNERV